MTTIMSWLTLWWTSSDVLDREIVDYLASQPDCANFREGGEWSKKYWL